MSRVSHEGIARLAEESLDALRAGRWSDFERLLEERRGPAARLAGATTSEADAEPIRRALAADGRSLALLEAARAGLGAEMADLARSGAGLRSYRSAAGRSLILDRKG